MEEPEDVADFLVTGQLSDTKTAPREYLGVVFIAFRCLYAEITASRIDQVPLNLSAAYDRTVSMVVSRLNAVGEKWLDWVRRGERKRHPHVIPVKHCEKCVMSCEPMGDYTVHGALTEALEARRKAARCERVRRETRPAAEVAPARQEEAPSPAAPSPAEVEREPAPDEWRDMSGDAITMREALAKGVHAQCTLSAVRNLRRNPNYSVSRLAERCYGAEYVNDIRIPDWPMLMEPVLREGEVVKKVAAAEVRAEEMGDFRTGVVQFGGHVICFHYDGEGALRVYDNDSRERLAGVPRVMRADEVLDRCTGISDVVIGVLQETSDLGRRLGPALTTLFGRGRA